MPRDARTILLDALVSGERIEAWTRTMTLEAFLSDRRTQAAVEREFEIVGEALTRLRREFPGVAGRIPELREVVDFRNLLSHGYDAVDHRVVWSLARHELSPLLAALRRIAADFG